METTSATSHVDHKHAFEHGIQKYFECSTAHITKEDDGLLGGRQDQGDGPCRHGTGFGHWVHVPTDMNDEGVRQDYARLGYSEAFIKLLYECWAYDCWWLYLDADGPVYGDLPRFDW